jgi:hypothetical protein
MQNKEDTPTGKGMSCPHSYDQGFQIAKPPAQAVVSQFEFAAWLASI